MAQNSAPPNVTTDAAASPLGTRNSRYRPALPEQQSALSRWIVKIELASVVIAATVVGARFYRAHQPDRSPVKIAAAMASHPVINLPSDAAPVEGEFADGADPTKGQVLYMQTCTTCHGQSLQGMPHQGVNLRDSKFVATTNDQRLIAFIKVGRKPADAKNTTGLLMPPRGGNPALDDDALANIVAFLRQAQKESAVAQGEFPATRPVASIQP